MSNVIKFVKKALTLGVVSTTVLWSVGVSALLPAVASAASCPTLNPGDMLKVKGKAAIYAVNNDGKVLYFPSGDEFKSWRPTYGGYVTVDQGCFDSLSVPSSYPGAVNFHPGAYVVKRPSSDQLYVVEPGNTLAKISVDDAKLLYGSNYKVMTVADAFWPHYVNRGPDVAGKAHPGMLVKNGGKTWYVDANSQLWNVSDAGMVANKFQAAFIHSVADSAVAGLVSGGTLDSQLAAVTDMTQSGGVKGGSVTPVASGSLSVALASDNPFAATIVSDTTNGAQAMIPVLKLVFTAGNDGDVKVTSLAIKRGGVSADTDISNMYLFDGDTQVASNPGIASTMATFANSNGMFTVSRGSSKTITVKLDLKNNVTAGKTISFSLNAKSDVAPAATGGSFPVVGNSFTTASTAADLGQLVISNVSPTAAGTVDPGTTSFEVWKFKAVDSAQDVELRKIKITMVGSINVGDLQNFSLWDGGTQVGQTLANMASDKTLLFDLTSAPYVVTKGQTKNLSLHADIVAGTNRTFYASIQNSGDVITYDRNYGVFLKTNGTDSFTIVQAGGNSSVNYTINTGTLTQTLAPDSPNGNVALSSTNVVLAKFGWKANGEDIKVSQLSVSSTASDKTNILKNVRLLVNGSQVGTTISSLTASGAASTGWGTFGNSFIIKAGTTVNVTVNADLTDATLAAGETVLVGFPAASVSPGSSNGQGVVSLTSISSVSQVGSTLTIKSGTVSVTKNTSFGDKTSTNPTGPVNATQVRVASFVITAGAGEDVTVSQIKLKDGSIANCTGLVFQNLTLKDSNGKQLGVTYSNPASTCNPVNTYAFNLSPAVTITNGNQYTVDVFADLKASTNAAANYLGLDSVSASGKVTGSDASANSQALALQNDYVSSAGNLLVETDPNTPIANHYLMGSTDNVIGAVAISASSTEAVNITQIVLSAAFGSGATGTMKNIRLIDNVTGAQVGNAVSSFSDVVAGTSSPTTTYSHATFTGLSLNIPAGVQKTLLIKVDFATYVDTGLSSTGQVVAPVILANYYTNGSTNPITATGAQSGSSLTAVVAGENNIAWPTVGGNYGAYMASATLYRARLTVAWAGDAPSGASSPSTAQTVAKFVITNMANAGSYNATVQLINFDLSTTISGTANVARALTIYKDGLNTTALATTSFGVAQTPSGTTTITSGNFTSVTIASGSSKTFYVTLDTTDAAQNKNLSIRIGSGEIQWADGAMASPGYSTKMAELPLQYKTFTY